MAAAGCGPLSKRVSLRVSVVCEDHTNDQYIVRPVLQRLLTSLGKGRASVSVVTSPRLRGYPSLRAQACAVLEQYGYVSDLVIFVVDADGEDGQNGRRDRAAELRGVLAGCRAHVEKGLVVAAIQEVEVWALWGYRAEIAVPWATVRSDRDVKEAFFDPLLEPSDVRSPGRGRQRLIERSLSVPWSSLSVGCPELKALSDEIEAKLAQP